MDVRTTEPPARSRPLWKRPSAALVANVGGPARMRVVAMLAAVLALSSADTATIGSIAMPLERGLHIGNTAVGLLVTLSTLITAVATLPLGALADRVDRTQALFFAVVLWSVAMVVNGLSVSFSMLLASRLALGIVMAVGAPLVASLTGDWFPVAERARIYGFVLSGELAGAGIGFVLSGTIADALSWRWAFWALAALGLLLSLFVHGAPEPARGGASRLSVGATSLDSRQQGGASGEGDAEALESSPLVKALRRQHVRPWRGHPSAKPEASFWYSVRAILSIRTNVTLIVASAFGYFYFSAIETFGVLFMQQRFGVTETIASSMLVLVGAGAIVGALVSGRVADRLLTRGYVPARPVVAGVAFLGCAALFVPSLLLRSLLLAAPLATLAAAALGATNPPLDAARLDLVDERMWGRGEALRTVLRSSFQAVAPLVVGYLSTLFGDRTSGLGSPTAGSGAGSGAGLADAFLVALSTIVLAGAVLLVYARRSYPSDVATIVEEELLARGDQSRRTADIHSHISDRRLRSS